MTGRQSSGSSDGWDALAEARWADARGTFEVECSTAETASALDGLAQARWWSSDISGAVDGWERAYSAYRRDGDDERAAHVALLLAREHDQGLANDALANGWLARAKGLLEDAPNSTEWGWVAFVESERSMEPSSALAHAERALTLARRARDPGPGVGSLGQSRAGGDRPRPDRGRDVAVRRGVGGRSRWRIERISERSEISTARPTSRRRSPLMWGDSNSGRGS